MDRDVRSRRRVRLARLPARPTRQEHVQGQVVEIVPDAKNPGDPIIRVKVTDPRWDPKAFGETVDVHAKQVSDRVKPKATLPKHAPHPDIAKTPCGPDAGAADPAPGPRSPASSPTPTDRTSSRSPNPPNGRRWTSRHARSWLKDRMEADLSAWRGEPTGFDYTGMNSGHRVQPGEHVPRPRQLGPGHRPPDRQPDPRLNRRVERPVGESDRGRPPRHRPPRRDRREDQAVVDRLGRRLHEGHGLVDRPAAAVREPFRSRTRRRRCRPTRPSP